LKTILLSIEKDRFYKYVTLKLHIMGKGKDAKKAVKKEPTKTPKERKAEKRLKKARQE
jgi:hypothetical protein